MKIRLHFAVLAALATCAHAQEVQPYQSQEIKPHHAQEVKPYQAQEIKPYHAHELEPSRSEREERRWDERPSGEHVSQLLGAWQSSVPGAVWTSPSSVPGWDTLHVSPGALAGLLVIYPDGTYVWNSYGGKRGRWSRSSDPSYPIVLDDRVERRLWKVGLDDRHPNSIFIWDGNAIYYTAHRAR